MITAAVVFIIFTVGIYFLLKTKNIKLFFVLIFSTALISTVGICIVKPVLHKQFSISIIDYLIKFHNDGSMTTTKQTTSTTIKEGKK
ncbi:hypothetical protein IJ707_03930 [bacterium]|nr:hypothetical protein [bacterium]